MGVYFSKFMFWLENIFFIPAFFAFELCLLPFVYLMNFYTILWATSGTFMPLFYTLGWLLMGPFLSFFIVVRDVYYFFNLLTYHDGCKDYDRKAKGPEEDGEDEAEKARTQKLEIDTINELRIAVIEAYLNEKKIILQNQLYADSKKNDAPDDKDK